MPLVYPLVEGHKSPWPSGEIGALSVRVKIATEGKFTFYTKSVAGSTTGIRYEPSLGTRDQQDEYVYRFDLTVGR